MVNCENEKSYKVDIYVDAKEYQLTHVEFSNKVNSQQSTDIENKITKVEAKHVEDTTFL